MNEQTTVVPTQVLYELTWHLLYPIYKNQMITNGQCTLEKAIKEFKTRDILLDERHIIDAYSFVEELYNDNIESGFERSIITSKILNTVRDGMCDQVPIAPETIQEIVYDQLITAGVQEQNANDASEAIFNFANALVTCNCEYL